MTPIYERPRKQDWSLKLLLCLQLIDLNAALVIIRHERLAPADYKVL